MEHDFQGPKKYVSYFQLGGQQTWNLFHYPTRYYPTIWLLSSLPTTFLDIENTGGLEFSYLLRIHKSIGPPPPLLSAIGIFCKYYRTMIGGSGDILWERMVGCLENGPKWYFGFTTEEVQLAKMPPGELTSCKWERAWQAGNPNEVSAPEKWLLHQGLIAPQLDCNTIATWLGCNW